MLSTKRAFMGINLLLGPLVPLSYIVSARVWPDHVGGLWGAIPESVQPLYTANMLLATGGFLVFTWFFFRHTWEPASRFLGRFSLGFVNLGYLLVLIPSMLWMPMTLYALAHQIDLKLWIQLVLALVAIGTIMLALALYTVRPAVPRRTLRVARIGVVFFAIQTVLLDAIIWPIGFEI